MTGWEKNTDTLHVLSDKYAIRFVTELGYRCTAFKFFWGTATYSDTLAFWHEDFASPADAIKAAKNSLLRGELAIDVSPQPFDFASSMSEYQIHKYDPDIEKRGW